MRLASITTFLIFSLALLLAKASNAMEFSRSDVREGTVIKASGVIEIGDTLKLAREASGATVDEKGLRRIVLTSPGGNVAEAIGIAAIIRANNFMTLVDGECASACAMILYPAGQYSMLLDGGRLGFHACYNGKDLTEVPECTEACELGCSKWVSLWFDKGVCRLGWSG